MVKGRGGEKSGKGSDLKKNAFLRGERTKKKKKAFHITFWGGGKGNTWGNSGVHSGGKKRGLEPIVGDPFWEVQPHP